MVLLLAFLLKQEESHLFKKVLLGLAFTSHPNKKKGFNHPPYSRAC